MKYILFGLTILSLSSIYSCRKDVVDLNQDIVGNWIWKSSHASNGTQMLSNDSTKTFSITFTSDHHFSNTSFCIIGASTEGTFEVIKSGSDQILILKSDNNTSYPLKLNVENNHLMLVETYDSYSWFHDFYRQ